MTSPPPPGDLGEGAGPAPARRRARLARPRISGLLARGVPRRDPQRALRSYLGEGERPLLVERQHPLHLAGALLEALGLAVPLALVAWGVAGIEAAPGPLVHWVGIACAAGIAWSAVRMAWRVLAWDVERIVVTNQKVIHLSGVLHRRIASTPLSKVSEFTVRQPLAGRICGYGSLVVDVPGGREQALHGLDHVPDPAGIYRLVSDLAGRGRAREGGGTMPPGGDGDGRRADTVVLRP